MSADDLLYAPISSANSSSVIPPSWRSVMQAIQGYRSDWKYATLAGGALRDLDNKRQIKDVDIFLPYHEDTAESLAKLMHKAGMNTTIHEVEHLTAKASNGGAPAPHYVFQFDGWYFEISQRYEPMRDYREILDTFDLGLCMICLDGDKVYRSWAYQEDVQNETITIIRATGGSEFAHARRILQKYPGWRIIPLNRP